MNWKDVAIGAASSLGVTIIGGVALYYLTKEPSRPEPRETLVFAAQHLGQFQSETMRVAMQTIRIANVGDAPAAFVSAVVSYPKDTKVADRVANLSTGLAGKYNLSAAGTNRLDLEVPSLAPNESLTISVVLDQSVEALPEISLRSLQTIGRPVGEITGQVARPEFESLWERVLVLLLPFLALLQVVVFYVFFRRRHGYPRSSANSAFALAHSGDTNAALVVIDHAMARGRAGPEELCTRALCLALQGDLPAANQSLTAAEMFDSRPVVGYIEFHRSLVELAGGDQAAARLAMERALEANRNYVVKWAERSGVFRSLANDEMRAQLVSGT